MSSGDHTEKKRSSTYADDDEGSDQHDHKRHKHDGKVGEEHHHHHHHGNGHGRKKNGKHPDSVSNETASQAIHGMDEKHMQELVENIYRLKMPKDLFDFWDFCCRTNPMNPKMALSSVGIELVGPFDILAGDVEYKPSSLIELQDLALTHWRYYYDVPEFQTCLKITGSGSQLHYGYFRDDPKDLPVMVASNEAGKDCKIYEHGTNLFAAVYNFIRNAMEDKNVEDPAALAEMEEMVKLHAGKFKHSLAHPSSDTRFRRHAVTSPTWHGAGIVGQPDSSADNSLEKRQNIKKEALKRLLEETCNDDDVHEEAGKKRKLDAEEKLISIAKDIEKDVKEGIYDTTLEFAVDLFCYGNTQLHKQARAHFIKAYGLLGRDLFAEISAKHMDDRLRGEQLNKMPMK